MVESVLFEAAAFKPVRVLLLGDLMLDAYTFADVKRISPEAPVPVAHVQRMDYRAGGAGNVALNLRALGADVTLLARRGDDADGEKLCQSLQKEGCDVNSILVQNNYPTTLKNRIMAGSQQIVRLDREALSELPPELLDLCMRRLPKLIEQHDIIALSDYAKGFLSDKLLRCVIGLAAEHAKAVIIDPKGTNFQKYRGATWIKPNEKEAYEAAGLDSDEDINVVAARLIEGLGGAQLMITRSAKGISVFPASGERKDFSVHVREVVDVTGAGDTVLAVLTMALAQGSCIATSARLANIAAGLAIETVGCARISSTDIRQRLLQLQDMLSLQG